MSMFMGLEDNAREEDLGEEEPGFWDEIHKQNAAWVAKYGATDDGDADAS